MMRAGGSKECCLGTGNELRDPDACAGAFEGVAHVAALLDATLSRPLRHCLLRLAEALLLPAAARGDERAARAAAANADAFIGAGGVQLAVDLVAGAPLLG